VSTASSASVASIVGLRIWADCHGSRSWYNRHGAYRDGIYDSRTISVEREEHPRKLKTLSDPTLTSGFFHLSFPRRPEHRRCIPTDRCGSHFYRSPTTAPLAQSTGNGPSTASDRSKNLSPSSCRLETSTSTYEGSPRSEDVSDLRTS